MSTWVCSTKPGVNKDDHDLQSQLQEVETDESLEFATVISLVSSRRMGNSPKQNKQTKKILSGWWLRGLMLVADLWLLHAHGFTWTHAHNYTYAHTKESSMKSKAYVIDWTHRNWASGKKVQEVLRKCVSGVLIFVT